MSNFIFILLLLMSTDASGETFRFQGHVDIVEAPEVTLEPPATEVCQETEDPSEEEPQCVMEIVYE